MNLNNIMIWNERFANDEEIIRKCEEVKELCEVRDRCVTSILNREEIYTIIEFLCTYKFFIYVFFLISNVQCKMRIKNYQTKPTTCLTE